MEMGPLPKVDVISNLQENLIEAILMLLPIRDAVRTSILSRKWRNKWTTIPQLVFNEKCAPPPSRNKKIDQFERVSIIDQVLLHHSGPIHKFECSSYLESCPCIDRWILFLSKHGIKEFTLDCLNGELYKVPSYLFSFQDMTCLNLANCIITPPTTFIGFHHLTSVHLINSHNYEYLLSKCPLLERLTLAFTFPTPKHLKISGPNLKVVSISGNFNSFCFEDNPLLKSLLLVVNSPTPKPIKISGPNLLSVAIGGNFNGLCFEDTPLLASVSIISFLYINNATGQTEQDGSCNLIKVLGGLHSIQILDIRGQSLQFLTIGNVPVRLPISYNRLSFLQLWMNFNASKEILAVLCLFRSSPNLGELTIEAHSEEGTDDKLKAGEILSNQQEIFLTRLVRVSMKGITGTKLQLEFVKLILANAPVLYLIDINFTKKTDAKKSQILKELTEFPRASTHARINIR